MHAFFKEINNKRYQSITYTTLLLVSCMVVLQWADILARYALWVMMTYLTDAWMINFTHAAAIVNFFNGSVVLMPIGMAVLVDVFMGHYKMLLLSSLAYSIGLSFLAMSTPPVLSNAADNCSDYERKCIGNTQRALFSIALVLIAVGRSGHRTSSKSFLDNQTKHLTIFGRCCLYLQEPRHWIGASAVVLHLIGGLALPYISSWSVRFGIPAIYMVIATFLFLTGTRSYKHPKPHGSPLTTLFRVFVASHSKRLEEIPMDAKKLYKGHGSSVHQLPHTRRLRCLDKAAIILPTQTGEQPEENRWKLCTVTEVEETKIAICMIPVWMTFILCGIVSSVGNTYFLVQADRMSLWVGIVKVRIPILLLFYELAKYVVAKFYVVITKITKCLFGERSELYGPPFGIAIAMIFSILSCITASKVETRRLHEINKDPPVKISIFWLLPQYLLLGALDGISIYSVNRFFKFRVPKSMARYLQTFSRGVSGLGVMGSGLSVYIAGKVSPSWFTKDPNKSHLDNYYWMLSVLGCVNLVLFILAAIWFVYQNSDADGNVPQDLQNESSAGKE